ncbi:methylmalonyl Co-A mutase-associated GTPase MeaB [Govanella unica]|uniref:Methylmalonyl Co-A mutase-associated GTPase MeaB n=1 Tax=Govanella unica TaxID=2975056 RepID=A0A9X3TVK0_9PROT|nr:methylmalonyl Co-A mutase-associated GTPase MeaB [Govania unica]MDA5192550.1 methylmalonyl Co-A mutase-associated GTPase MeaB [Govania unica]
MNLIDGILSGNRRALGKAITLVESTRADHRLEAQALMAALLPHTGGSMRLGLSGAPGVGKSSFIEAFGQFLTARGLKVAVLAIDPSSARTGGSILGDKTRMEQLAHDPLAFIRPSPSGCTLGGVARRTREAMLLCEAAGYDVVMVETVGVGQSETAVADMVDMFLLLLSPGGGDELQGIKRGIMELADLVIVNKADGDLEPAARRAQAEYRAALHIMRPKTPTWIPHALRVSALKALGLEDVWAQVEKYRTALTATGELEQFRAGQAKAWMWSEIHDRLTDAVRAANPAEVQAAEAAVTAGTEPPGLAAERILARFLQP